MNNAIVTLCTALMQVLHAQFHSYDKPTQDLMKALSKYVAANDKRP